MSKTTEKTSISLSPAILEAGKIRAEELGFGNSFSAYVAKLIRDDLRGAAPVQAAENKPAARAPDIEGMKEKIRLAKLEADRLQNDPHLREVLPTQRRENRRSGSRGTSEER